MNDVVLIIVMGIILLLALLVIPQLLVRRAVKVVLQIFRDHGAVGKKRAKTVEELGLQPKSMFDRMMKPRDYKPRALDMLINANIIQTTEDGKLYLSEEDLAATQGKSY